MQLTSTLLIALTLGAALEVAAQPADPANAGAAQTLFDQAVTDMGAGRFSDACPKLEEAVRLVPDAVGAKVQLAECYEGWGRKASAWSQWNLVSVMAGKQGQTERREKAEARMAALKPTLATLTVVVPSEVASIPGLRVTRDGAEIGKAQWDNALPADAGPHEVTASAPNYETVTVNVEVLADGAQVSTTLPMLEPTGVPPVPLPGPERPWQMPLGVASLVVGGVGLGLGGLFGGLALMKRDESNAGPCDPKTNICSDDGIDARDAAIGFANASTALFVVGGVIAAGGIVVVATAPRKSAEPAVPGPQLLFLGTGVAIRGDF